MNKIMKSFRLNKSTCDTLENLSIKYGISQSDIIDNTMKFIETIDKTKEKRRQVEDIILKMILT